MDDDAVELGVVGAVDSLAVVVGLHASKCVERQRPGNSLLIAWRIRIVRAVSSLSPCME